MALVARTCKICQGGFKDLFRSQNIKQRAQNVFKIQVNIDGNVCCPTCLYHLDTCQELIVNDKGLASPPKLSCNSCGAKGKLSHKCDISKKNLPKRLLQLPYFSRLLSVKCGPKLCPKCIVILDFSKKFLEALQTNIIDEQSPPSEGPEVGLTSAFETLAKEVNIPRAPLIVKLSIPARVVTPTENCNAQSDEPHPPTDPLPPFTIPDTIKLPKGPSVNDLRCYVKVERLRVPPITIRKLQSIIRVASPDKIKKRVSFSNRHSIAEIPSRKDIESCSSSQDEETPSRRPRPLVNYKTPKPFSDSSESSEEESEGQVRLVDLRSRIPAKRALYTDPPSSSSESEEDVVPLKKFKVTRPAEAKRNTGKISESSQNSNGRTPTVQSPGLLENSPTKRRLFVDSSSSSKSSSQESVVPRPNRSSNRKSSFTSSELVPSTSLGVAQEQSNSSQSPRRRNSIDSVGTVSTTDKDESPLKIVNRRKTMGSTQSDAKPVIGQLRLIPIDKLRAPDPQVDLLLYNIRSQTYLPNSFLSSP